MRSVKACDLKVKILWSWDGSSSPDTSVSHVNDQFLELEKAIPTQQLSQLRKLVLSFKVAGKWKSYDLTEHYHTGESPGETIAQISFSLPKEMRTPFKRDFALARF